MDVHSPSLKERPTAAPPPPARPSAAAELRRAAIALHRRWRLAALTALGVFALVLAAVQLLPARYTATAQVLLDPRQAKVVDAQAVLPAIPTDVAGVETQVQVLASRGLAERLAARLALESDPELNPSRTAPRDAASLAALRQAVAAALMAHTKVQRSGMTNVIDVKVTSRSPTRAADLANALVDLYLAEQTGAKAEATRRASAQLDERLDGLRTQVQTADEAVQRYRVDHGLITAGAGTLTEQAAAGLSAQIADARAHQAEAEAQLSTARTQLAGGSAGDDVAQALGSPVIQALRAQRAQVSRTVADLAGRYGPLYPERQKAEFQLADIDGQIKAEVARSLAGLEAQARAARQRTDALAGNLAASRSTLAGEEGAGVQLAELQRGAESARAVYASYLDRYKQTTAQAGIEQPDAHVLAPARPPSSPTSPKLSLSLIVATVAGLAAGGAATAAAESFATGFSTAEEVEKATELPWLGAVPLLGSALNRISARQLSPADAVVQRPHSHFAEALRSLRTSLLHARAGEPVHVIAVCSALPGEGKSTTSLALARTFALAGQATVLVDCDLRRRGLNTLLGREPALGLLEVLSGEAALDGAIAVDEPSGARVLSVARWPETAQDVLGGTSMARLLEELRGRFDVVVLDTPPVLATTDARILAARADLVLFLARWRSTPRPAVERSLRQLEAMDAVIAGVALTQVDVKEQARAGYGDPGRYYKRYADYYVD